MSPNMPYDARHFAGFWGLMAVLVILVLLTVARGTGSVRGNSLDMQATQIRLVSAPPTNGSYPGLTTDPSISYNGRYIVFGMLENFEQNNIGIPRIIVRDVIAQTSEIIPIPWERELSDPVTLPAGDHPSISGDGRFVVFATTTFAPSQGDVDSWLDIYIYDRIARTPAMLISKPTPPTPNANHFDHPQISADGNYVLFQSGMNIANEECSNYFIYNRTTDQATCLGIPSGEERITRANLYKDMLLVFTTNQDQLGQSYLYHLDSNELELLTFPTGEKVRSNHAVISANGRYLLFIQNLGHNGCFMFVKDLQEHVFTCLDTASIPYLHWLQISPDGQSIAFNSSGSLVQEDKNDVVDVYLYEIATGALRLISQSLTGEAGNDWSDYPQFSADGRSVVFVSAASDLVENDFDDSTFPQDPDLFLYDLGEPTPTPTPLPTVTTMADVRQNGEIQIAGNLSEGEQVSFTVPLINVGNRASFMLHPYIEGTTALGDLWRADNAQPSSAMLYPGEVISFTVTHPLWHGHAGTWRTNGVFLWNNTTNTYDKPLPANGYSQQLSFLIATPPPTFTPTPTDTPTVTLTPTDTATPTSTPLLTQMATPTFTPALTFTSTWTPTGTATPTFTSLPTQATTPTFTPTPTPPFVSQPLRNVVEVENGYSHTCVLTTANGVKCWGLNDQGQLGDGTTTTHLSPVTPLGLSSNVTFLDVGYRHSCVLTSGGAVKCWGANGHYQLGDGTNLSRLAPVDITGLATGVTAIAAGGHHTCVLTDGGGVKCWGWNDKGQLGDGTHIERATPVDVVGLSSGVRAIAATGHSTCALTDHGGVKCWGDNQWVQLGDGTNIDRSTPVDVVGLTSGVQAISPAGHHTCALLTTGGVTCWGFDYGGEVGDGPSGGYRSAPVDVVGLSGGVSAIATGGAHSCALLNNGNVKCWGWNNYGQLGNGATTNQEAPVAVVGLNGVVSDIGGNAGDNHTCVVTENSGVKCWGRNETGELGDGTMINRAMPVDVIDESPLLTPTVAPFPTATATLPATSTPASTQTATSIATGTTTPTATPAVTATATVSLTPTVITTPDNQTPLITEIVPNQGYNDTPNEIMIYGSNFQDGLVIRIGTQVLTEIIWRNSHHVQGVVPAGLIAGTYDVVVSNPDSSTPAILAYGYSVLDPTGDDFSISSEDLWTAPPTIHQGETVMLGANVHRKGGKAPKEVTVAFYRLLADGARQLLGQQRTVPMLPGPEVVESIFIEWDTSDLPEVVEVMATIDPDNNETETTKNNNETSRTFRVLSLTDDLESPLITRLQANNGAPQTDTAAISVTIEANDVGNSGVATMYLIEREFNSSARQWVAVQNTGWIPFQNTYSLMLTQRGGIRYIQAFVSDSAGNISETMVKTRINYNPPSDRVLAGQVRLYRYTLTAGQHLQVRLETINGDADLYIWQPDGNRSWVSNAEATSLDSVSLVAPQSGNYQVEIFGYQTSNYRLTVAIDELIPAHSRATVGRAAVIKQPRHQPIIAPNNEPMGGEPEINLHLYLPIVQQ